MTDSAAQDQQGMYADAMSAALLFPCVQGGRRAAHTQRRKAAHLPVSGVEHAIEGVEVDACAHVHCRAKVNDFHIALRCDQNVLRLHIPVHNACAN